MKVFEKDNFETYLMKHILTISITLLLTLNTIGQGIVNDTINQYNENGKKHGYWVEYVDNELKITKKKKALFFRYRYFDNGVKIGGDYTNSPIMRSNLEVDGNKAIHDSIVIMNGVYKMIDEKRRYIEQIYDNGKLIIYNSCGVNVMTEYLDCTQLYQGQLGSCLVMLRDKNDKVWFEGYLCKKNGKWGVWSNDGLKH